MSEYEQVIDEIVKHGVVVKVNKIVDDNYINHERKYVGCVVELDFSEHDKVFEDKIANLEKKNKDLESCFTQREQDSADMIMCLKRRIAELESENLILAKSVLRKETKTHEPESKETLELPFDPLECANYLINATYERETSSLERAFAKVPDKVNSERYTVDDLEQIAEHLLVYCKHNKESE